MLQNALQSRQRGTLIQLLLGEQNHGVFPVFWHFFQRSEGLANAIDLHSCLLPMVFFIVIPEEKSRKGDLSRRVFLCYDETKCG